MATLKYVFKNTGNGFVYVCGVTSRYTTDIADETWPILCVIPPTAEEYEYEFDVSDYTYLMPFVLQKYNPSYKVTGSTYSSKTTYNSSTSTSAMPSVPSMTANDLYFLRIRGVSYTYNGNAVSVDDTSSGYSVSRVTSTGGGSIAYVAITSTTGTRYVHFATNFETEQTTDDLGIYDGGTTDEPTITINEPTLKNCTVSYNPTAPTFTDTLTFTCTPNEGYAFTNAPYATINVNGSDSTINGVINDDGTATITITFTEEKDTTITVNASANISKSILICKNYGNDFVYLYGTKSNVSRETTGDIFGIVPYDGQYHTYNIDKTQYDYVIPIVLNNYLGIASNGSYSSKFGWLEDESFMPTKDDVPLTTANFIGLQTIDNHNVVCVCDSSYSTMQGVNVDKAINWIAFNCIGVTTQTYDDIGLIAYVTIKDSTVDNATYTYTPTNPSFADTVTVVCTPNDGYHFSVAPYATLDYDITTTSYEGTGAPTTTTEHKTEQIDGVLNDDGTATITITFTAFAVTTVGVTAYAIADEVGATGYLYQLFNVSEDNLQAIAQTRYVLISNEDGSESDIDLGKYIHSLKKFYCAVPHSDKTQLILLGTYKVDTKAPIITDEIFDIDCGAVTFEEINKNSTDYTITVNLYLPFIGNVSISSDKVMGRTVNLIYTVSSVNGACVAKLVYDGVVLDSYEGSIAVDLPYITYSDEGTFNQQTVNNTAILYGYTPYAYANYQPNYNDENGQILDNNRYGRIGSFTNYNEFTDLELQGLDIPSDEIDMIVDVLQGGIYL